MLEHLKTFNLRMKLLFALAVPIFLPLAHLCADWRWENDLAVASLKNGHYQAVFKFENLGKKPLTVDSLNFPCPCTVYQFKAEMVAPGKSGTMSVTIDPDSVETPGQEFTIIATGSDSATAQELTIRIPDSHSEK